MAFSRQVQKIQPLSEQGSLLHRMITRIRQSLQIEEVLQTTVTEIRAFLETDRVMVYRFHPDEHGEVIAEAIHSDRLPSLLGLHFPADDIPSHARELFLSARQRSIVDLSAQQIGFSVPNASMVGDVNDGDIRYRPVDPCHVEYLQTMGVQSSVVVPIVQDEQLWGLLVAHHSEPRQVTDQELNFLQLVVDQVEVAIDQSALLRQVQEQAQRDGIANQVATLLHATATPPFQAVLETVAAALRCAGGRLYLAETDPSQLSELYTCGEQPLPFDPNRQLEQHYLWQDVMRSSDGEQQTQALPTQPTHLWAIADLYQDARFRTLTVTFKPTKIRSVLMVSLQYGAQKLGCLTLFRQEIETETLWAGQVDPDIRQTMPRESFAAWREQKKGQAQIWTPADLNLVQAIGCHFSLAIGQYQLQQQVLRLNANLEEQVHTRTAELRQSNQQLHTQMAEREQAETALRQSEARFRRLAANIPAMIYQFRLATDGTTYFPYLSSYCREVYEVEPEVIQQDASVLLNMVHPDDRAAFHASVADSAKTLQPWLSEHRVILPSGQVKWLQAASRPERQENGEIVWDGLLIDVSDRQQAELALRQSEAELREKAQELEQTLRELQQTQAQLVQTEKMSSLGQLVAGVAHEINNPVNFIYGNLNHAGEYAKDLLNLLQLYQQYYPHPAPEIQAEAEAIDLEFLKADLPKLLSSMKVGADRIQSIVLALRNFSRMDEAEVKPVDLHEGIDSTLMILQNRLKETAGHAGITIIKDYGELPQVECYAGQLNQVFMNILSNAIDALEDFNNQRSPEACKDTPSIITIQTQLTSDRRVQIRISDNGAGMPEKVRKRLFEPFFTTKPVGKGTGLGLSISYQVVVDKHGGNLKCSSSPGQGAEFVIELPLVAKGCSYTRVS